MSRASSVKGRVLFCTALAILSSGFLACGNDDENCAPYDSHEFPVTSQIIEVRESVFFPSVKEVVPGSVVEWRNMFREARTVISGTGPADSLAGEIFNETLLGYCSGEAIGGRFQKRFTEPDTIHYFNSIDPTFTGTLIIRPL